MITENLTLAIEIEWRQIFSRRLPWGCKTPIKIELSSDERETL